MAYQLTILMALMAVAGTTSAYGMGPFGMGGFESGEFDWI